MVGFAKTVTMRAQDRVPLGEAGYMNKRLDYLDYIAADPQPGIAVIQDIDEFVGFGATCGMSRIEPLVMVPRQPNALCTFVWTSPQNAPKPTISSMSWITAMPGSGSAAM